MENNYDRICDKLNETLTDELREYQICKLKKIYRPIFYIVRELYNVDNALVKKSFVSEINKEIIYIENSINVIPHTISLDFILSYYEKMIEIIKKAPEDYPIMAQMLLLAFNYNIVFLYCINNSGLKGYINVNMNKIVGIYTELTNLTKLINNLDNLFDQTHQLINTCFGNKEYFNVRRLNSILQKNKQYIHSEKLTLREEILQIKKINSEKDKDICFLIRLNFENNIVKDILNDYKINRDIVNTYLSQIKAVLPEACVQTNNSNS